MCVFKSLHANGGFPSIAKLSLHSFDFLRSSGRRTILVVRPPVVKSIR